MSIARSTVSTHEYREHRDYHVKYRKVPVSTHEYHVKYREYP
jgi:hypothetical protein